MPIKLETIWRCWLGHTEEYLPGDVIRISSHSVHRKCCEVCNSPMDPETIIVDVRS
jgi:hypothetical protein